MAQRYKAKETAQLVCSDTSATASSPWPATGYRPPTAEGTTGPQRPLRYWESRAIGDKTAIIPRLNGLHGWGNLTRLVLGGSRGLRSPYAQNSSQSQLHIAVVIVQDRSRSSTWRSVSNDAPHHNVSTSTGRTRYAHDLSITRSPLTDPYHLFIVVSDGTTFKHMDSATCAVDCRATARKANPVLRFGIFHRIESIRCCVLAQCERPVRIQPQRQGSFSVEGCIRPQAASSSRLAHIGKPITR